MFRNILLVVLLFSSNGVRSQLSVNQQGDLQQLVQSIAGPGVRIANPVIDCHGQGHGTFSYTGSLVNASSGVLLTTGTIANALGPNTLENTTFEQFTSGSSVLSTMTGRTTYDACHLEFDLIPTGDSVRFNYTFASEEYAEWVGSQYSDVFGIFISGPGITGDPGLGGDRNLALVPVSNEPVMINTVNGGMNSAYFQDNTGNSQIQYDGLTRQFTARSAVSPCATYRIKLVVADVADRLFDSGLFIGPIQSSGVTMSTFTSNGLPYAVEGCNPGTVRFARVGNAMDPLPVTFYLGGTATNGTDYPLIGSNADPLTPHTVTIPAGQPSVDVVFNAFADGMAEGSESIRVYLGSAACPGFRTDSLDLILRDDLQLSVSPSQAICAGNTVNLNASGATNYSWTPATGLNNSSIAAPIASPSATTTYSVTGTTGSCSRSLSTTVTVSNMTLSGSVTHPLCQGQSNGIINLTVSGGSAPFTYAWTGPNGFSASTEDLVNVASGTYTVSVLDGSGCTRSQSFNVSDPPALTVSVVPSILPFGQNISCFGGSDGLLDLTVNGGTPPYAVLWNGPAGFTSSFQDISGLSAGTYSVSVTDQNGCTIGTSYTLIQTPALVPSITSVSHVTCFGASNGSAMASISGGIPPYSYSWNSSPVQTSATATGLPPGPRTVTITDGYGCTTTASVTITQPAAPLSVTLTGQTNVIHCQGQSQQHGTATAVPSGGTPPYTFHWNTVPAQTTAAGIFMSGGTYTVTVTDAQGCTATRTFTVNQPGTPTATSVQTNVSCFGSNTGTATINISGGSNIQSAVWNTVPPQFGISALNLPPGTWTLTAQHADGCQSQFSVTILGPTTGLNPTFGAGNVTPVSCTGGSNGTATVSVSGGGAPYSYSWNTSPVQTGQTATGLSAGTYTVTVIDAFGCSAQANVIITQPAPLSVNISSFTNVLCFGGAQGTANAQASGGIAPYSYSWNSSPIQTGPNATDLPAGTYTVTATDARGCTASTTVTINGPSSSISATFEAYSNETCFGASDGWATVLGSGGSNSFTYTWNTSPPTIGPTASGLAPGTYEVEVVDNNGCDSPKYHSITILGASASLDLQVSSTDASCTAASNGSIDLTVSGGVPPYSYAWTDPGGGTSTDEDRSGLAPGMYDVTVTDAYGCALSTTITLDATNDLGITTSIDQIPCIALNNGALTASVVDGTPPYSISWNGPAGFVSSDVSISGLTEGNYQVQVIDGNGCSASSSIGLNATAPPSITLVPGTFAGGVNISCAGASDGQVDMTIAGGTAPFSISWTDGLGFSSSDEDIMGISPGVYQVSVVDASGCTVTDMATLTAPAPIDVTGTLNSYNGSPISCANAVDGGIDVSVSGGTPNYAYAWDTGSTDQDLSDLGPGTYTLTVTDQNNCVSNGTWTIASPAPLNVSINVLLHPGGTGVSCFGLSDGQLQATASGGTAPYTLAWSNPAGFASDQATISGLQAATYTIQVTDANGCIVEAQSAVTTPAALTVAMNSTTYNAGYQIPCSGEASGNATATVSGGSPVYSYSWTGPSGFTSANATISGLEAGNYAVTITDAYGCTTLGSIELTEPAPLDIQYITSDAGFGYHVGCSGMDGSISTTISGGTPSYTLDWTGPDGSASMNPDLSDLSPGNYHLSLTDANGCTSSIDVTLTMPDALLADLTASTTACPGDTSGSITSVVAGGVAPYTHSWSGPNGFSSTDPDVPNAEAGPYVLSITDAMGCIAQFGTLVVGPEPLLSGAYVADYGLYNLQCIGDSSGVIEFDPQGGTAPYSISVTGPNGYSSNSDQLNGLTAGTYNVNIMDANGCAMDTVITLTEPVVTLSINLDVSVYPSGTNISCYDGSDGWIEASVTGGNGPFSFTWRGPDSLEFNTPNIYGLPAGDYSYELVVIDDNGCSVSTSVTLIQPDTALHAILAPTVYNGGYNLSCNDSSDGSIDISTYGGNGGYVFSWTGPSGTQNVEDPSGLGAGIHFVNVTDMNGCVFQDSLELIAPEPLLNLLTAGQFPGGTTISCNGAADGSIVSTIGGGVPGYALSWSGPNGFSSMDPDIQGLSPGTYCLTLTDANSCTSIACSDIQEPAILSVIATSTDAPCGAATGAVSLSVVGGSAPYVYSWNSGSTDQGLVGVSPGNYSVIVTDLNGCTSNASATVAGSTTLQLQADVAQVPCHGDASGSIDLNVLGGTAPMSYQWNNGDTSEDPTGLPTGSYSVTVTDAMGCTSTGTWQISSPPAIVIDATISTYWNGYNISEWSGSDGSVGVTVNGGVVPYGYQWSNNATTPAITGLEAGTYTVMVTDGNGCSSLLTIELNEPSDLVMPTGYSPNGDGANDQFIVQGLDAYPANTLVIFNRWGNVVYDRLNYRNDWGGENSQGQPLPNGTYFAILQVENGARTLQGYVDLRR